MGLCFSLHDDVVEIPTAKVVSVSGDLREYAVPAAVSLVLQAEAQSSSSLRLFLCNSDHLCYDDHIPAMDPADHLQADQLYFVLPASKLQQRLSSQDMAALAVKASVALQKKETRRRRSNNNKSRISPVLLVAQSEVRVAKPPAKMDKGARISRSGSGSMSRRFNKLSSRRARLAVRSFRLRLSTIHEGLVLTTTAAATNTNGHT